MSMQAQTCPKVWSPSSPQHILSAGGSRPRACGTPFSAPISYFVLYTLGMTNFFKHGSRSLPSSTSLKVLIAPEELVLNPSHSSQGLAALLSADSPEEVPPSPTCTQRLTTTAPPASPLPRPHFLTAPQGTVHTSGSPTTPALLGRGSVISARQGHFLFSTRPFSRDQDRVSSTPVLASPKCWAWATPAHTQGGTPAGGTVGFLPTAFPERLWTDVSVTASEGRAALESGALHRQHWLSSVCPKLRRLTSLSAPTSAPCRHQLSQGPFKDPYQFLDIPR